MLALFFSPGARAAGQRFNRCCSAAANFYLPARARARAASRDRAGVRARKKRARARGKRNDGGGRERERLKASERARELSRRVVRGSLLVRSLEKATPCTSRAAVPLSLSPSPLPRHPIFSARSPSRPPLSFLPSRALSLVVVTLAPQRDPALYTSSLRFFHVFFYLVRPTSRELGLHEIPLWLANQELTLCFLPLLFWPNVCRRGQQRLQRMMYTWIIAPDAFIHFSILFRLYLLFFRR